MVLIVKRFLEKMSMAAAGAVLGASATLFALLSIMVIYSAVMSGGVQSLVAAIVIFGAIVGAFWASRT